MIVDGLDDARMDTLNKLGQDNSLETRAQIRQKHEVAASDALIFFLGLPLIVFLTMIQTECYPFERFAGVAKIGAALGYVVGPCLLILNLRRNGLQPGVSRLRYLILIVVVALASAAAGAATLAVLLGDAVLLSSHKPRTWTTQVVRIDGTSKGHHPVIFDPFLNREISLSEGYYFNVRHSNQTVVVESRDGPLGSHVMNIRAVAEPAP